MGAAVVLAVSLRLTDGSQYFDRGYTSKLNSLGLA